MAEAPEEKRTVTITIDQCQLCYDSAMLYDSAMVGPTGWVCNHKDMPGRPREIENPEEIPDWCPRLEKK